MRDVDAAPQNEALLEAGRRQARLDEVRQRQDGARPTAGSSARPPASRSPAARAATPAAASTIPTATTSTASAPTSRRTRPSSSRSPGRICRPSTAARRPASFAWRFRCRSTASAPATSKVIGVLAMSVDLGEFNVLEKRLPAGTRGRADRSARIADRRRAAPRSHPASPGAERNRPRTAKHCTSVRSSWPASTNCSGTKRRPRPAAASFSPTTATRPSPATSSTGARSNASSTGRADEPTLDTGWLVLVQEPVAKQ